MNIVSLVIVFILAWWMALFMVLPWGLRQPDKPDVSSMGGAPVDPNIKRKFMITTILACVFTFLIWLVVESDMISFHDIAMRMMEEDR